MTTISESLRDIGGVNETDPVVFYVDTIRENASGTGTTTTHTHTVRPINGVVTTEDLDPGPARVRIGLVTYPIVIPDSVTTVRLWPLIDASVPPPAITNLFVRNGGGVARQVALTAAEYAAIPTPDPETVYFVIAD